MAARAHARAGAPDTPRPPPHSLPRGPIVEAARTMLAMTPEMIMEAFDAESERLSEVAAETGDSAFARPRPGVSLREPAHRVPRRPAAPARVAPRRCSVRAWSGIRLPRWQRSSG